MRILIPSSTDFSSSYGGGQVYVRALAYAARDRGHKVCVVCFRPDSGREGRARRTITVMDSITIEVRLVSSRAVAADLLFELSPQVLAAAREYLLLYQPDIVHANGWKASFARVCHELKIPCVITAHHGGIVCPGGALLDWEQKLCQRPVEPKVCASCCRLSLPGGRLVDGLAKRVPRAALVRLDHLVAGRPNIPFITPAARMTTAPERMIQSIRSLALPGTIVAAPSRAIAGALVRNGVPTDQVVVVPHGIHPFEAVPFREGLGQRPVRFVFVGRINPVKGLHVLLAALARIPAQEKWELDIVGQAATEPEERYQRLLRGEDLDWSRITWHGQVDRGRVAEILSGADVLVLPSICLEVFGLVIPEAFSAGRPVVATKCGGPEDLIRDGVDGRLVEPGNVRELSRTLQSLIRDPLQIEQMAANIQPVRTMEQHFRDLERMYVKLLTSDRSVARGQLI